MMENRKNRKGFTIAELLIVVAIIGVLVAISVPIFTSQLKKSRIATNQANARAAKSAAVAAYLESDSTAKVTYEYNTTKGTASSATAESGTSVTDAIDTWDEKGLNTMGSKVYSTWYVTVDENGGVTRIAYSAN